MQSRLQLRIALLLLGVCYGFSGLARAEGNGACVRGKATAPIKLEIFSDFQCPSCRAFYLETLRSVFKDYADTGKVCVVFRAYPGDNHVFAPQAARYGEAALRLGAAQWNRMADALFSNQDKWAENGDLEAVISKVLTKTDMDALRKGVQDQPSVDSAIYEDIKLGLAREVNSTPTFFITAGGKTEGVAGALRYSALKRYLDARLPK